MQYLRWAVCVYDVWKKYMDNVRQEANIATGGVISCVHNTEKHILICFANWTLIQFCIASLIFGDA